jgi:predicted nucleotide-binding protein
MLIPKTTIFIVYGHNHPLLKLVKKAIDNKSKEGYRVKYELLDDEALRKQKSSSIFDVLNDAINKADAAIVLTTGDDMGCEKYMIPDKETITKSELVCILQPRARQNVILELGMLFRKVGNEKVLILIDIDAERPSDLIGRYWNIIKKNDDVIFYVNQFIEQIARKVSLNQLSDETQVLDFFDLRNIGDQSLIENFKEQFDMLDSPEDKALFLAERLVFDSYIQDPDWWRSRINDIIPKENLVLRLTLSILKNIQAYMRAWRPPNPIEYHEIELVCKSLDKILSEVEQESVRINPAVLIAAYDYLGLAKHKAANVLHLKKYSRTLLSESLTAYKKCLDLADKFDDMRIKLWTGYALFNKARATKDLIKYVGKADKKRIREEWKEDFMEAIQIRCIWKSMSSEFPSVIQNGLITEYYHAISVRILMGERNIIGRITEDGSFSIDDKWIEEKYREYQEWCDGDRGNRVRLATNVRDNWKKINENFSRGIWSCLKRLFLHFKVM